MPTILDLFENKQLPSQGGQTAQAAYDIRDSKDIDINVADPLVNSTGILLAKGARKLAGIRGSETFLEQELTGVRIIRTGASAVIYGSELPRLTLRTTPLLDTMKSASGGDLGGGGSLGNAITDARDFASDKLGIPSNIIPTKVVGDDRIKQKGVTQNRMIDLAEIKGSPSDKLLAELLRGGIGGNLKTIGKQAIGGAINIAKDRIRGKLFGDRSTTGFNDADPSKGGSNTTINYGSLDSEVGVTITTDSNTGIKNVSGLMYSKTINLTIDDTESNGINFVDASSEGGLASKTPQVVKRRVQVPTILGFPGGEYDLPLYSELFNNLRRNTPNDSLQTTNDELSNSTIFVGDGELDNETDSLIIQETQQRSDDKIELSIDRERFTSNPNRAPKFSQKITRRDYNTDEFIENKYFFNSVGDAINARGVYDGNDDVLDKQDFITLKFKSIPLNKTVNFRSTITGLNETFSPSWESSRFIGNPFSFYTYDSIERSVSFNFTTFSMNAQEHKTMWDKLNFLQSLVYPQGYYPTSAVKAPLLELTLGSMYNKKVSFIESLSFATPDNSPWQIADTENYVVNVDSGTGKRSISSRPENMKDYKLPHFVNVSIGLKLLESRSTTESRKFYSFTPQTN